MDKLLFPLILVFVIINIVQTWLIFAGKLLIRDGMIIGAIEVLEFPLIIYLISKGRVMGFLVVVFAEIAQWSIIAYFSTRSKMK